MNQLFFQKIEDGKIGHVTNDGFLGQQEDDMSSSCVSNTTEEPSFLDDNDNEIVRFFLPHLLYDVLWRTDWLV